MTLECDVEVLFRLSIGQFQEKQTNEEQTLLQNLIYNKKFKTQREKNKILVHFLTSYAVHHTHLAQK